MTSTYILIDTTLIGYPANKPWIKKRRKPCWIAVLYEREAIEVSPILIDIERAVACNRLDTLMELVNAQHPQLGISFIETELTLFELQAHLREFIYVKTEDDAELTLRFADCAVLPSLSTTLTAEQWSSIVAPFKSWKIHGRDGKLKALPVFKTEAVLALPLLLHNDQIGALERAMRTDLLLSNLRKMRPGRESEYSTIEAHQTAERTRQIWLSAGREENSDLLLFARDVFDTDGRLLHQNCLAAVLEQADPVARHKDLQRLTNQLSEVRK